MDLRLPTWGGGGGGTRSLQAASITKLLIFVSTDGQTDRQSNHSTSYYACTDGNNSAQDLVLPPWPAIGYTEHRNYWDGYRQM